MSNKLHNPLTSKAYLRWAIFTLLSITLFLVMRVQSSPYQNPNDKLACNSAFIVSSWFDNSLQAYDGCDQTFLGLIDTNDLVKGPQSLVITPQGDLLVVSEGTNQLVLFKRQNKKVNNGKTTTQFAKPIVVMDHADGSFLDKPVGALFDKQGRLYVASYSQNSIVKIDPLTWQITDVVLSADDSASKIKGVDAGFVIENQRLLIPGYDSDNVIQVDLNSKTISDVLTTNQHGLDAARSLFVYGDDLLISAERSNKIMRFNKHTFERLPDFSEVIRPASITADGEQHILVTTRRGLVRFELSTGKFQQLINYSSGQIKGGTYAIRIDRSLIEPLLIQPSADLE